MKDSEKLVQQKQNPNEWPWCEYNRTHRKINDDNRLSNAYFENIVELRRTENGLKYCLKCEQVWAKYSDGNGFKLDYHLDFPTYGLRRITCDNCEKEELCYQDQK